MRLLSLLGASLIAAPTGLTEAPPLVLRGDRYCVDVTDTPGEVVAPARDGVRFVRATRSGLQPGPTIKLGEGFRCEAIATSPTGAGVIAGTVGGTLVVAVRDPGGAWSAPVTLAGGDTEAIRDEIAAAVSERGDAIVAWKEHRFGATGTAPRRFRVARRAPGAAFGAVEPVGVDSRRLDSIVPGIAATGEAFLVTSSVEATAKSVRIPVEVAIAPPGGRFATATPVTVASYFTTPSLAVAADGGALIALSDGQSVVAAERAPGGAFAPAAPLAPAPDQRGVQVAARLRPNGAAVVTWQGYREADVHVVTRAAAGPFSPARRVLDGPSMNPPGYDPFYDSRAYVQAVFGSFGKGTFTSGENSMRVALTPDGAGAVVTYARPSTLGDLIPQLAVVPLAGGPAPPPVALGPVYAQSGMVAPLVLADGTAALIWTEGQGDDPDTSSDTSAFRLRLAAQNLLVAVTPPSTPRVTFGTPRDRTLDDDEPLRLPVTCSSPCQVHAIVDVLGDVGFLRLPKGGRGVLRVYGASIAAPARPGRVRLRMVTGAPSALYPATRTVTVRIAHARGAGVPRPSDLRARRVNDKIEVSFRAPGVDEKLPMFVTGDDALAYDGEPLVTRRVTLGRRERTYRVTLPGAGVHVVAVRTATFVGSRSKVVVDVP